MTFTTVGLPYFSARVKKIVQTADPANPENNRYPQVLAWILRISSKRDIRSGRNMIRMSTCSQKTITLASNSAFSGIRHALSVPQSAAPRPTSHGPYVARRVARSCISNGSRARTALRQYGRSIRSNRLAAASPSGGGQDARQPHSQDGCAPARAAVAPYHSSRFVLRHGVQNAITKKEQRKEALTPQQIVC